MRPRIRKLIWIAPFAIVAMVAFMALGGYLVLLLWNWLLPALFGIRLITFWQALGILVLSRILFGGFGWRGSRRPPRRMMEERCDRMTPEERERFRARMREFFGFEPSPGESKGQ